jgi:hypothetical protein
VSHVVSPLDASFVYIVSTVYYVGLSNRYIINPILYNKHSCIHQNLIFDLIPHLSRLIFKMLQGSPPPAHLVSDDVSAQSSLNILEDRSSETDSLEFSHTALSDATALTHSEVSIFEPWWCDRYARKKIRPNSKMQCCGFCPFNPSRRTIIVLSVLLHFLGSGFIFKTCVALAIDLFNRTAPDDIYKFILAALLWLVAAVFQSRMFWKGSFKLLNNLQLHQDELHWWHFLPPGKITLFIVIFITVNSLIKRYLVQTSNLRS